MTEIRDYDIRDRDIRDYGIQRGYYYTFSISI